jgi:hypothetical protein
MWPMTADHTSISVVAKPRSAEYRPVGTDDKTNDQHDMLSGLFPEVGAGMLH